MQYGWSALATQTGSANTVSGNWTPLQLDSSGNLSVTLAGSSSSAGGLVIQGGNTIPVFVSGSLLFTGTVTTATTGVFIPNNADVVGAVSTGNGFLSNISGRLNNGIAITGGSLGVTITGLNTGLTFPISAPLGIISIDTGVRAVNVTNATLNVAVTGGSILTIVTGNVGGSVTVAVTGGTSGAALGSLDLSRTYLPVSGVGTFATTVAGTVTTNTNITNTAPLAISGVVQASVSTVDTGIRAVNVTNPILAVSGTFAATVSSVAVTGFPSTIAPLAVSGFFTPIWTGAPNVTASVTIGNLAITGFNSTIAPLAVSGVFNATTDNTSVVSAIATGNGYLLVANRLASGISGALTTNLDTPAWVTGQIQLTGVVPVSIGGTVTTNSTIVNTAPLPVSGVVQSNVTNGVLPVSGNVIINSGTYVSSFSAITGSQVQIPVGTRQWSIAVESGGAYVNGVLMNAPITLGGGGYDGRFILSTAINVGTTGGRVIIITE